MEAETPQWRWKWAVNNFPRTMEIISILPFRPFSNCLFPFDSRDFPLMLQGSEKIILIGSTALKAKIRRLITNLLIHTMTRHCVISDKSSYITSQRPSSRQQAPPLQPHFEVSINVEMMWPLPLPELKLEGKAVVWVSRISRKWMGPGASRNLLKKFFWPLRYEPWLCLPLT